MSSINFDNVYFLFIAIPLLALMLVPFCLSVKKDNRNGHNVASVVLHVLMAVVIAFAAAGTQFVTVITQTNVYVLADVSYSANKNLDTIDNYIQDLSKNLPRNSKMGIICFGKECVQLTSLGGKIKSVKTAEVDDSETNITEALEYAGGLFKDNVIKHIVLITDGSQTYSGDSNELKRTVSNLRERNVHVDAIYIDDALSENAKEIQLSGAQYTKNTYLKHNEEVTLTIESSFATDNAKIELYKNGELAESKDYRAFPAGTSQYTFTLDTTQKGIFDYEVKISDPSDECGLNNEYSFTQNVSGDVKVMFVGSNEEDVNFLNEIYGEKSDIDSFINDPDTPYTLEDLCKYDEFVLSDIDLEKAMPYSYEVFMKNLDTAVSVFGKSLITFGNLSIQDKPQQFNALSRMLPVRFGEATEGGKLYTIVVDVSYSMNYGDIPSIIIKAAEQVVETLTESDSVCIIPFSGSIYESDILEITSLKNKDKILEYIENLRPSGQGTSINAGLKKAFEKMRLRDDYSEKQAILITDGRSYASSDASEEDEPYFDTALEMRANGIHTSVICACVGGDEGGFRKKMKTLAENYGGGWYFPVEVKEDLDGAQFEEIIKDSADREVTEATIIKLERERDGIIAGDEDKGYESVEFVTNGASDYVDYYVVSRTRGSIATDVLMVNFEYKISETKTKNIDVPLLSYWNRGNGKVASYTGRLAQIKYYGGEDDPSKANAPLFKNLLTYAIPVEKVDSPYIVNCELDGKSAKISMALAEAHSRATAAMTVTTPSGEQTDYTLTTSDMLSYSRVFRATEIGKYKVSLKYTYGGTDYTTETYFYVSYEPEYDAFTVYDAVVLFKMLDGVGTVSLDGKLAVVNDEDEQQTYTLHLTMPLMAAAVALFVADIIIRKLKWKDIVSLFGLGRRSGKSKDKK